MSEDKKTLIDLVPDSVDNAVKNITDKLTQNIGTTLADIWYLVFGGISHAAEKRKIKYSYALQEFKKELDEKISKIPDEKLGEPDIQILSKALEGAKYSIDKEEFRHIFSSFIYSSLNKDIYVSPFMINIVNSLSSMDAKILKYFFEHQSDEIKIKELNSYLDISSDDTEVYFSLMELHYLNLIDISDSKFTIANETFTNIESTKLSILGLKLCVACFQ